MRWSKKSSEKTPGSDVCIDLPKLQRELGVRIGERGAAAFLDEFHRFVRIRIVAALGVVAALLAFIELRADQMAEF